MPEPTKEWEMTVELVEFINCFETDEQEDFIRGLYHNLDPYLPFLEQQSEKQLKWLYALHEKYCNDDPEAAAEIFNDPN